MAALIELRNIVKTYGAAAALSNVSLSVAEREVVFLIGPSGSGKSTLLRCCNLLERPTAGEVHFAGEEITHRRNVDAVRQSIGMVFQSFNLYPHLNALWNVAIALLLVKKLPRSEARERAIYFLGRVGLADRATSYPTEMSGGQQQRVAIARALALQPLLMLFDEPTSALDPELVGSVLDVMRDMRRDGMTMLIASHEMQFAREAADRVVFLDGGRIVEEGPPARIFGEAREARTRAFLSRLNRS